VIKTSDNCVFSKADLRAISLKTLKLDFVIKSTTALKLTVEDPKSENVSTSRS